MYVKGTQESTERISKGQSWTNLNKKIYIAVYNPNYKINTHEYILIKIMITINK